MPPPCYRGKGGRTIKWWLLWNCYKEREPSLRYPIIYLSYLMNATLILWRVGGLHNHGSHQADFSATLWRVSAIQVPCRVSLGEVATVFADIVGRQQLQKDMLLLEHLSIEPWKSHQELPGLHEIPVAYYQIPMCNYIITKSVASVS